MENYKQKYHIYKKIHYDLKNCPNNDLLSIQFDSLRFLQEMTLESVQKRPAIKFDFGDNHHTLIMVDPDAPSRTNPIYKYYLHWMIVNNNETIIPFEPSTPPKNSGPHRYFFYLFEQPEKFNSNEFKKIYQERKQFNLNNFIYDHKLMVISCKMFITNNDSPH